MTCCAVIAVTGGVVCHYFAFSRAFLHVRASGGAQDDGMAAQETLDVVCAHDVERKVVARIKEQREFTSTCFTQEV